MTSGAKRNRMHRRESHWRRPVEPTSGVPWNHRACQGSAQGAGLPPRDPPVPVCCAGATGELARGGCESTALASRLPWSRAVCRAVPRRRRDCRAAPRAAVCRGVHYFYHFFYIFGLRYLELRVLTSVL